MSRGVGAVVSPEHEPIVCWFSRYSDVGPCNGRLIRAHLLGQQRIKREVGKHAVWDLISNLGIFHGHWLKNPKSVKFKRRAHRTQDRIQVTHTGGRGGGPGRPGTTDGFAYQLRWTCGPASQREGGR